jgi:diamine N-acetyltransferase
MIYGKRLRLRGIEKADLVKFQEWINDPEVIQGLDVSVPQSMLDEQGWLERAVQREPAEKPLAIEVRAGRAWKLIGNCGFFHLEWINRAAELGILIGEKSQWNKGYGTEAVELLVRHGFENLNLNRIYLRVFATNPGARRAYEKAGFVLEGTARQGFYKNGKFIDDHQMSVLRSEWDSRQEGR